MGRRKQAAPLGRGARRSGGSKGSAQRELRGLGRGCRDPLGGFCCTCCGSAPRCGVSPAKVRAWHPKTGMMLRKGGGAHPTPCPLWQPAAQAQSPPVPVMTLTGQSPLPVGQTLVLLIFKLSLCTGRAGMFLHPPSPLPKRQVSL